MKDNLQETVNQIKTALTGLKTKSSSLKIALSEFDSKIDRLDSKIDKLVSETDIYKTRLIRENNRKVKSLELALENLRTNSNLNIGKDYTADDTELRIATSISIFETIIEHICENSDDYKLMCYSVVYPLVYERINRAIPNYLIDEVPSVADQVIHIGRQELVSIRKDCDMRLTDPDAWDYYKDRVFKWWVDFGLTLILNGQDKCWETDQPYSLLEMLKWKNEHDSRPLLFSKIYDVYEIYRKYRREVYIDSGLRDFEVNFLNIQLENSGDTEKEEDTWIAGKSPLLNGDEAWSHEQY